MEKKTFTRTELYDLVWSELLLTISKKYNISDIELRKICSRLNILVTEEWALAESTIFLKNLRMGDSIRLNIVGYDWWII